MAGESPRDECRKSRCSGCENCNGDYRSFGAGEYTGNLKKLDLDSDTSKARINLTNVSDKELDAEVARRSRRKINQRAIDDKLDKIKFHEKHIEALRKEIKDLED